jgi:hypothetical protein
MKSIEQLAEERYPYHEKQTKMGKVIINAIRTSFIAGWKAKEESIPKEDNEAWVPLSEHEKAVNYISSLEKQLARRRGL